MNLNKSILSFCHIALTIRLKYFPKASIKYFLGVTHEAQGMYVATFATGALRSDIVPNPFKPFLN